MDEPGDGAVLPERGVVGGAEGEVADEADDGLDERPARRRVHQAHDRGQAALQPDGVLRHLALCVARGQVPEGAHGRLGYLLPACTDTSQSRLFAKSKGCPRTLNMVDMVGSSNFPEFEP